VQLNQSEKRKSQQFESSESNQRRPAHTVTYGEPGAVSQQAAADLHALRGEVDMLKGVMDLMR
jgi:hypothetical protein